MTSVSVPYEAASHLTAMLVAFSRQIFEGFLDEADELAGVGQNGSAILIAGTVLEYLERSRLVECPASGERSEVAEWRRLRDQAAHVSMFTVPTSDARHMIDGVRKILRESAGSPKRIDTVRRGGGIEAGSIKGKYSYVPSSAEDFMQRKREDLDLEDRG